MSITNSLLALVVAAVTGQAAAAGPQIQRILQEIGAGGRPPDGVRFETQCRSGGRFVEAAVHGTGTAIWNEERQGTVAEAQARSLAALFVRERFAEMPPSFGEDEDGDERLAVKMACRVRVRDGGLVKDVIQLDKGRQSAALKRLADAIVTTSRTAAAHGATAGSLDEGLAAIADGRLAVETLRITLRDGEGRAARAGDATSSIVRLDGRDLDVETDGGSPATRRVDEPRVRDIARALHASGFASLPRNVRAQGYTDVSVEVLGHEHGVQARAFAGTGVPDPATAARLRDAIAPLLALR